MNSISGSATPKWSKTSEVATPQHCVFCEEFQDVEKSEFRALFAADILPSRILAEDARFALMVGMGAMRPGYVLLLPKEHVTCFADLKDDDLALADEWRRKVSAMVLSRFGEAIYFEHGSTRLDNRAGGCILHAHLHFAPASRQVLERVSGLMPSRPIQGLKELTRNRESREPYILAGRDDDARLLEPPPRLPSQYMRRMISEIDGYPYIWDWAAFPGKRNMLETYEALIDS